MVFSKVTGRSSRGEAEGYCQAVGRLIAEWQSERAGWAELQGAEHPDIIDHHGRVWTWWKGDLYRHCKLAWPRTFVEDGRHGLPGPTALNNPNYAGLCGICTGQSN